MPENHECAGLEAWRAEWRERGKIMPPEPERAVRVKVRGPGAGERFDAAMARVTRRFNGSASILFLVLMVGTFLVQLVLLAVLGPLGFELFAMHREFVTQNPWAIVTSIFAHGGFNHLFFNGIFLVFFGPTLERVLGQRRFVLLFLGAGMLAGVAEVVLSELTAPGPEPHFVLGASGSLMALLGTLTILAPSITVYFMFLLPIPIWVLTALYALGDLSGAFSPASDGIAHFAHLAGLAVGVAYGYRWKRTGILRRPAAREPPSGRRFFVYRSR